MKLYYVEYQTSNGINTIRHRINIAAENYKEAEKATTQYMEKIYWPTNIDRITAIQEDEKPLLIQQK